MVDEAQLGVRLDTTTSRQNGNGRGADQQLGDHLDLDHQKKNKKMLINELSISSC